MNSIDGDFVIEGNSTLINLNGINNLNSIGKCLNILANQSLLNISAFNNVSSIGGTLYIYYNTSLGSLSGLDNIASSSITNLSIQYNYSLSNCNIQSICNYLINPGGIVDIYNNGVGCNDPPEIANICGIILPCLPYGNYYFLTQHDIDSFQVNYHNCTEINGSVVINGNDISNLNGLSPVTTFDDLTIQNTLIKNMSGLDSVSSISGYFDMNNNDSLLDISGLELLNAIGGYFRCEQNLSLRSFTGLAEIDSIGKYFWIKNNDSLISLIGLDNLTIIGEEFEIRSNPILKNLINLKNLQTIEGNLIIVDNNSLKNLLGFDKLNTIKGNLQIAVNDSLQSLTGIDSMKSGTINNLSINFNPALSECDIKSICNYLANPTGIINIQNNDVGCNSSVEIEDSCNTIGISTINLDPIVTIYPNPAKEHVIVSTKKGITIKEINIYNLTGQKVLKVPQIIKTIDISMLLPGLYVIELNANNRWLRKKLIICYN